MKKWKQLALALAAGVAVIAGVILTLPVLRPSAEGAPADSIAAASRADSSRVAASAAGASRNDAAGVPGRQDKRALATKAAPPGRPGAAARRQAVEVVIGAPTPAGRQEAVRVLIGGLLRVPTRGVAPEPVPPPDRAAPLDPGPIPIRTAFGTPAVELPELLNRPQVARALRRMYPPELARSPVGGVAVVRARIGEDGRVGRRYVAATSGNVLLDRAALAAAAQLRFAPARFEGRSVRSEVDVPIEFRVENDTARTQR